MSNWAYVENFEIKELHDHLPANWNHISGLNLSSLHPNYLKQHGWYSIIEIEFKNFDSNTQKEEHSYQYNITLDRVEKHTDIIDIPKENIITKEKLHKQFMENLDQYIERELIKTDRTQLKDFVEYYGKEISNEWAKYRNSLRDMPKQYEHTNITNMVEINIPTKPYSIIQK